MDIASNALNIQMLREIEDGSHVTVAGHITEMTVIRTKKGRESAFADFEDATGSVEIVVFDDLYEKAKELLYSQGPLLIYGILDKGAPGKKYRIVANTVAVAERGT